MILNQAQAEAVYSAMCALNNVSNDTFRVSFPGQPGRRSGGKSHIYVEASTLAGRYPVKVSTYCEADCEDNYTETYADQSAFATAYGIDHGGEPQSDLAAAAGGLTQTAIER